jgi:probable phosphoglycerate mutase
LLLVRHGRTRWNVEGRRLGRTDVPLDDVGVAQAQALCRTLQDEPIDHIFASPLCRARETALPLAEQRSLVVHMDDDLLEFDYGELCGSRRGDVKLKLGRDFVHTRVAGGESLADAWARAARFARRIAPALSSGVRLLVVGHQRINWLLAGVLEGRTLEAHVAQKEARQTPGSVIAILMDSDGHVSGPHAITPGSM